MTSVVDSSSSAPQRLQAAFAAQVSELVNHVPAVRSGDDSEAVHDMRVAVRRLRSVLRAARPLLERQWVEEVREELAWIGDQLGAVRDLEVLSLRLHAQAQTLSGGDATVAAVLLRPLQGERAWARRTLEEALSSDRFARLGDRLRVAVAALPVVRDDLGVGDLASREFKRLRRRSAPDPQAGNAFLHKRRIRVKRARYAAELVDDSKAAHRFVRQAKLLQDLLGAHQDAVVARRHLRRLARESGRNDTAILAGRLIQLQEQEMQQAREALPKAWKRLLKRGRAVFSS